MKYERLPGTVALRYKEYDFNEHEVCLNPDVIEIASSKNGMLLLIRIAESPIGFVTGYRYEYGKGSRDSNGTRNGGGSSPACYNQYSKKYSNREEAIKAQLISFDKFTTGDFSKYIQEYLAPKTMSLFA